MRTARLLAPAALLVATIVGCGTVPNDPGGPNGRLFAAAGVIEGTVVYQGPRPCSSNGHIVGNAILLVFDRRNPPPPAGLAVVPANFADVLGDVLFANEPRYTGSDLYCPPAHGFTETITASAPFAVSPLAGASYEIEAFFDTTGDFLPTFKFRQLPEQGDVGGGDIDTVDALKAINVGNPDYQPHFLPVDVGVAETATPDVSLDGTIPIYDIPSSGYVVQNVTVSIGEVLPTTRPYFYAEGITTALSPDDSMLTPTVAEESDVVAPDTPPGTAEIDPNYMPILTIPQDLQALSPPGLSQNGANLFEQALPHLKLVFGVPDPSGGPSSGAAPNSVPVNELSCATGGACPESTNPGQDNPFHFQLQQGGSSEGAFDVFQNAVFDSASQAWVPLQIAEGNKVPMLWPVVILSKLVDDDLVGGQPDPEHTNDPSSITPQGSAGQPVVIMQGITLLESNAAAGALGAQPDTLYNTAGASLISNSLFDTTTGLPTVFPQDHLMVALRPSVICFSHLFDDPPAADQRGVLVTPFSQGEVAEAPLSSSNLGPIVPPDLLSNADPTRFQVTNLVSSIEYGCLPKGRYAINVVYPDGQAWTVPNETGACSGSEGTTDFTNLTCTLQPRPVLYSQGNRAVVEVVGATNPANCQGPNPPAGPPNQGAVAFGSPAPGVPPDCLPTQ